MSSINLKIESQSKIKRLREIPQTFDDLKSVVESQFREISLNGSPYLRNYSVQYRDGQKDLINVSDDEDLLTAYDVANKELQGNLKFQVTLKQSAVASTSTDQDQASSAEKRDSKKGKKLETKKAPKESKKKPKKTVKGATSGQSDELSDDRPIRERASTFA